MPQMSPMNWFFLMLFNLMNFMFLLFYLYFLVYKSLLTTKIIFELSDYMIFNLMWN